MSRSNSARFGRHHWAVLRHAEEVSGCYGISRQLFYKWQRRYDHRPMLFEQTGVGTQGRVATS